MAESRISEVWARVGEDRASEIFKQQKGLLEQLREANANSKGALILYGDSWFKYWCPASRSSNMSKQLTLRQFKIYDTGSDSGATIQELAQQGALADLSWDFNQAKAQGADVKAILLCGGGNDAVGKGGLYNLLHDPSTGKRGLKDAETSSLIDGAMFGAYATILRFIKRCCTEVLGRQVPTYVHGYDYPVPDPRNACVVAPPWLHPEFLRKGYNDHAERKAIAKDLIDRFNTMLKNLPANTGEDVRYVNLRQTLPTDDDKYQSAWENELHPTLAGFGTLTDTFLAKSGL